MCIELDKQLTGRYLKESIRLVNLATNELFKIKWGTFILLMNSTGWEESASYLFMESWKVLPVLDFTIHLAFVDTSWDSKHVMSKFIFYLFYLGRVRIWFMWTSITEDKFNKNYKMVNWSLLVPVLCVLAATTLVEGHREHKVIYSQIIFL